VWQLAGGAPGAIKAASSDASVRWGCAPGDRGHQVTPVRTEVLRHEQLRPGTRGWLGLRLKKKRKARDVSARRESCRHVLITAKSWTVCESRPVQNSAIRRASRTQRCSAIQEISSRSPCQMHVPWAGLGLGGGGQLSVRCEQPVHACCRFRTVITKRAPACQQKIETV
jgi:hypothetical protein